MKELTENVFKLASRVTWSNVWFDDNRKHQIKTSNLINWEKEKKTSDTILAIYSMCWYRGMKEARLPEISWKCVQNKQ